MPGLRTLALTVAVRGGAKWETEATSGWSHCLEHLVFKGAGEMGAREIVERIEAEGGSLNAATGYERTSFEVRALHGSLPLAMQVVSDLVFRPTLDADEIEREKDVVAQEIAEAWVLLHDRAAVALWSAMFHASHTTLAVARGKASLLSLADDMTKGALLRRAALRPHVALGPGLVASLVVKDGKTDATAAARVGAFGDGDLASMRAFVQAR